MENKTFYDWLEVSPKASPEVIEKAYKALVIKYHPDLQKQNKQSSEDVIKRLNEAYSVLSDSVKRKEYDEKLKLEKQRQIQMRISTANKSIKESQQSSFLSSEEEIKRQQSILEEDYYRQVEEAKRQAYHDAYIEDMKNRGYKVRKPKSIKDYIIIFLAIFITFFIIWLIWQIPFVRNWINNLADSNLIVKLFVDIIKSFYEALFDTFF